MITLAQWSIDDYHRMIQAGILQERHVELLEGKIIEMSPEGPLHRTVTDSIAEYLRDKFRGCAKVYEAHPISLSNSEPEPDITVVRLPISLYNSRHPLAEEIYLLIEVSDSTLDKDLEQKRITYARAGIVEYWVVDLNAQKLIVFQQPFREDYQIQENHTSGILSPVAFSQVKISVEKLVSIG